MNQQPLHKVFIYNRQLKSTNDFIVSENTGGIYEVFRVKNRVPLFLDEHLQRFYSSAKLAGVEILHPKKDLVTYIALLIKENDVSEGNILLSAKYNLKAFFIAHKYPDAKWYDSGVACGILHAERSNPNAKVFQTTVRQRADALMEQEGYYEVLLVDTAGRITEGSRSNVFFVEGNKLITPHGNGVLLGITRQKILQLAHELSYEVIEQDVMLNNLNRFEAAFITGTSPKVLPVSRINNRILDAQNIVVQQIRLAYDHLIDQYVENFQPEQNG